jgi:hypothetical protein
MHFAAAIAASRMRGWGAGRLHPCGGDELISVALKLILLRDNYPGFHVVGGALVRSDVHIITLIVINDVIHYFFNWKSFLLSDQVANKREMVALGNESSSGALDHIFGREASGQSLADHVSGKLLAIPLMRVEGEIGQAAFELVEKFSKLGGEERLRRSAVVEKECARFQPVFSVERAARSMHAEKNFEKELVGHECPRCWVRAVSIVEVTPEIASFDAGNDTSNLLHHFSRAELVEHFAIDVARKQIFVAVLSEPFVELREIRASFKVQVRRRRNGSLMDGDLKIAVVAGTH